VKSFTDQLYNVYRAATVDDVRVSCVVTHVSDEDAAFCLDYINSIVVSAAVSHTGPLHKFLGSNIDAISCKFLYKLARDMAVIFGVRHLYKKNVR